MNLSDMYLPNKPHPDFKDQLLFLATPACDYFFPGYGRNYYACLNRHVDHDQVLLEKFHYGRYYYTPSPFGKHQRSSCNKKLYITEAGFYQLLIKSKVEGADELRSALFKKLASTNFITELLTT